MQSSFGALQLLAQPAASVLLGHFQQAARSFNADVLERAAPSLPSTSGTSTWPPSGWMSESLIPQICAVPKRKVSSILCYGCLCHLKSHSSLIFRVSVQLSPHRRGNRRIWYYLKRKQDVAKCTHCGQVGSSKDLLTGISGNGKCNGQCMRPFQQQYAEEYQPPC